MAPHSVTGSRGTACAGTSPAAPDDRHVTGEDYTIFGGEPIVMDLRFPPPATLGGRIVDDAGRPVPGVKIRIAPLRLPRHGGQGIAPQLSGILGHPWCPRSRSRRPKPVPHGRFRLGGLPREAGFGVDMEHPRLRRAGPLCRDDRAAGRCVRLPSTVDHTGTGTAAGRYG